MGDFHDNNRLLVIVYFVENPVVPLAEAVFLQARELFEPERTRFGSEALNALHNLPPHFQRKGFQFFDGGSLDEKLIVCHGA